MVYSPPTMFLLSLYVSDVSVSVTPYLVPECGPTRLGP